MNVPSRQAGPPVPAHVAARAVAAPLHRHRNEDEYSCVLEGTLGALPDDDVVTAEAGSA